MVYLGADNNLEQSLLNNAIQLKNGYAGGCNVILFIDRYDGLVNSAIPFDENFTGCRMYRLEKKQYIRLYGNETFSDEPHNSGNAKNLAGFISYCKENYPADKYALFLGSHGSGCINNEVEYEYTEAGFSSQQYSLNNSESSIDYSFILNGGSEANMDDITPSEMSSVLTKEHYVDIMAFDICYMGNYEFLYEIWADENPKGEAENKNGWCPKYVVATPTTQGGAGYYYKDLVRYFDPNWHQNVGVEEYALYILEAYRDYTINNPEWYKEKAKTTKDIPNIQICSVFQMDKIKDLKTAVDAFAKQAYKYWDSFYNLTWGFEILKKQQQEKFLYYFEPEFLLLTEATYKISLEGQYGLKNNILSFPFVDLYDMAYRVQEAGLNTTLTRSAKTLMTAVDNFVLDSFAGSYYPRFIPGTTGLSIWFPRNASGIDANSSYDKLLCSVKNSKTSGVGNWCNMILKFTPNN